MFDMEARRVIEALRSGIPSRAVGQYFSEARPQIMKEISGRMDQVSENGRSDGMVISGKYGEGKTHLLNTVFNLAHSNNMVVSYLSQQGNPYGQALSGLPEANQQYLPSHASAARLYAGFRKMTPNSTLAGEMVPFAAKELETDKLYYLLRAYMNTEDYEEKFLLQADLEGTLLPMFR